jgi:hypothetical protein
VEPPAFLILLFASCISVANPINTHSLSFFSQHPNIISCVPVSDALSEKILLSGKHKILFSCASAE